MCKIIKFPNQSVEDFVSEEEWKEAFAYHLKVYEEFSILIEKVAASDRSEAHEDFLNVVEDVEALQEYSFSEIRSDRETLQHFMAMAEEWEAYIKRWKPVFGVTRLSVRS